MSRTLVLVLSLGLASVTGGLVSGCSSSYKEAGGDNPDDVLERSANSTIVRFKGHDPSLDRFFNNAAGYAVFPEVSQGGAGIGAAGGDGVLYENGKATGTVRLSQVTVGAQLGGQTYSEIIFLQNRYNVDQFKRGDVEFSATASAVAASKGSASNADYADGVAIFVTGQEGLMANASIGGQTFRYTPMR